MSGLVTRASAAALMLVIGGCHIGPEHPSPSVPAPRVPFIDAGNLSTALAGEGEGLLLVEFCMPTGCLRCDQMREGINRLAIEESGVKVRRIDIRRHPELAWEFGVTVCPSYVAFHEGVEVYRATYPTSADLIMSGLDECLASPAKDVPLLVAQ